MSFAARKCAKSALTLVWTTDTGPRMGFRQRWLTLAGWKWTRCSQKSAMRQSKFFQKGVKKVIFPRAKLRTSHACKWFDWWRRASTTIIRSLNDEKFIILVYGVIFWHLQLIFGPANWAKSTDISSESSWFEQIMHDYAQNHTFSIKISSQFNPFHPSFAQIFHFRNSSKLPKTVQNIQVCTTLTIKRYGNGTIIDTMALTHSQ